MERIPDSLRAIGPRQPTPIHPPSEQAGWEKAQIEKAAEEFETVLTLQMLQQMQKSLDGGNLFGEGVSGDVYSGLAEWELARIMSRSMDFGIKQDILRQLESQQGQKP